MYCVNYRDNTTQGVNNTISEGQRVWKALGETLYAFELGNEIEGWNKVGRTPNWSPELYVKDYLNYTKLFDQYVFGPDKNKVEPRFQAGTFQGSGGAKITPGWNSVNVLQLGINNNSQIRSISQHDVSKSLYPYSLCLD